MRYRDPAHPGGAGAGYDGCGAGVCVIEIPPIPVVPELDMMVVVLVYVL
jgi:hypothetical protein